MNIRDFSLSKITYIFFSPILIPLSGISYLTNQLSIKKFKDFFFDFQNRKIHSQHIVLLLAPPICLTATGFLGLATTTTFCIVAVLTVVGVRRMLKRNKKKQSLNLVPPPIIPKEEVTAFPLVVISDKIFNQPPNSSSELPEKEEISFAISKRPPDYSQDSIRMEAVVDKVKNKIALKPYEIDFQAYEASYQLNQQRNKYKKFLENLVDVRLDPFKNGIQASLQDCQRLGDVMIALKDDISCVIDAETFETSIIQEIIFNRYLYHAVIGLYGDLRKETLKKDDIIVMEKTDEKIEKLVDFLMLALSHSFPNLKENRAKLLILTQTSLMKVNQDRIRFKGDIETYVNRFLHPYICGKMTKEQASKRKGLMHQVKEEFALMIRTFPEDMAEKIALERYLHDSAKGYYVWHKKQESLNVKKRRPLEVALAEAIPIDFPENKNDIEDLAVRALDLWGKKFKTLQLEIENENRNYEEQKNAIKKLKDLKKESEKGESLTIESFSFV